uniref:Uncharacterized protein n=1 Tax=Catharus ustulatus TaxID=91951 RepID=A0A8C3UZK0_CATUS
ERLFAKYYDDTYPSVKEQRAFEKNIFSKTHRSDRDTGTGVALGTGLGVALGTQGHGTGVALGTGSGSGDTGTGDTVAVPR